MEQDPIDFYQPKPFNDFEALKDFYDNANIFIVNGKPMSDKQKSAMTKAFLKEAEADNKVEKIANRII